ncbi:MAG: LPS assembly lipoprotein LptE [Oxalobacter formigenes]|nr:LPS assembly lipoprotein LptE [Oxalobacter formigenes]
METAVISRRPGLAGMLALLAGILLLSACGFSLRGTGGDYTLPFKTLYINLPANTYFAAILRRQIESAGATVMAEPKQAEASLIVLANTKTRETLSLSTAGRVREYALFYTFRFQVTDRQNQLLLAPAEIRLRRTLTYSESQAYAKEKEEEMLYENMENDVIQQVVQRMIDIPSITDQSAEPGL